MLDRLQIVLSHTSHPGNIGAAARAMKTMGLERLVLINPKFFPHADATARASGADDVLARARVVDSLDEALADSVLVLGTSARLRRIALDQYTAREAGERAIAEPGEVSVLFGRERSGLSNDEMNRCHALVNIPTNPAYGSMNLGSSVQVVAYELRMAALALPDAEAVPRMEEHQPAGQREMEGLVGHLEEALAALEFLHPEQSTAMMTRLRRIVLRARPSESEIHILRGVLAAAEKAAEIAAARAGSAGASGKKGTGPSETR